MTVYGFFKENIVKPLASGFITAVWILVLSLVGMFITRILFPECFLATLKFMDFVTLGLFIQLVSPSQLDKTIKNWKG